jgi:TonB-dependent receptor
VQTTGSGTPPTFANYTTTAGDPTLKPTMSNNFDLSVEWYPRAGTSLHAGVFYKRITDSVVYGAAQRPVTVSFTDGTTEQGLATTNDARTATQAATVKGVEVGGRVFLDRLPGWLSGIGVEANYTFLDSKNPGDLYYDIDGVAHNDVPLQGLSKHNANVAFLYEHNPSRCASPIAGVRSICSRPMPMARTRATPSTPRRVWATPLPPTCRSMAPITARWTVA